MTVTNEEVPRSDKIFPDPLAPNEFTPWHWVHFKVGPGPDEGYPVTHVGIYAEIIPQGHYWQDFWAPLD